MSKQNRMTYDRMTYTKRAKKVKNPSAKRLLELIDTKQTNLCVALDVIHSDQFLDITEAVGPEICLLKTHIDIMEDFSDSVITDLLALANKHRFMIFEDRKFADIGNTVRMQYESGVYHIVEWADFVNAHIVPGPGIIEGLKAVGLPKGRGLFLLSKMSSRGNLATGKYTATAYAWAEEHDDFVVGFIDDDRTHISDTMITMVPGISLESTEDSLQQQYQTPQQAIKKGADIIIVGRGIYEDDDPVAAAKKYRNAGWEAYLSR